MTETAGRRVGQSTSIIGAREWENAVTATKRGPASFVSGMSPWAETVGSEESSLHRSWHVWRSVDRRYLHLFCCFVLCEIRDRGHHVLDGENGVRGLVPILYHCSRVPPGNLGG
jgi:hypothetical protein